MSENKLTLEHFVAYLPFGLKMLNTKSGKVIDVRGVIAGISTFEIISTIKEGDVFLDKHFQADLWPLKPVLRPLSDIEKETEKHGFVLHNIIETDSSRIKDWLYTYRDLNNFNLFERCSFSTVCHLIENHFDVFGLIQAGLAIDINTLEK